MFTAQYGLIPYIKQITFRLYKVNNRLKMMLLLIALEAMFSSKPRVYTLNGSSSCGVSFLLNLASELSLQLQLQ